ncbi:polysaccharide pyruvyl transferase family protein [Hafnia paralvei]|uniref:polysaccharide pyruvyl transferase family protein n=2 Tax=Hafnia paralvei TaxID=546367 RepID=UPI0015859A50|nr:polysaccharide pyruvyl transferase family protein [Hafnia paralvei]MCE9909133.1 polysaccharide pyruvyl transferase family protein [Hafnia paralvei]NUN43096.1 polysaccharide pyruvyl transferase family protein [Hafnia paralvei]
MTQFFYKLMKIASFYIKLKIKKNIIPLCYFDGVPNVGDELNIKLVSDISGYEPVKPPNIKLFQHLCAVGSVLSSMNSKSIVWGSGLISEDAINYVSHIGDIRAVRGELTKKKIEEHFNIKLNVPMGDPALLIPFFVQPVSTKKKHAFGLVLHYADNNHPIKEMAEKLGGEVIDVGLPVEDFINKINLCEKILSSSMHGLILSDAYNIPNQRIILSDNIIGGNFKFRDYYSTTSEPDSEGVILSKSITCAEIQQALSMASVKKYIYNLNSLMSSFPFDRFNQ